MKNMRRKAAKGVASLALLGMILTLVGCSKGNNSGNLAFTQVKTTGVVETADKDKLTMIVSEDDSFFKKDERIVVTFQNIYLSKDQSDNDVLSKADKVVAGDSIYVIYSKDDVKDNVINVNEIVKQAK